MYIWSIIIRVYKLNYYTAAFLKWNGFLLFVILSSKELKTLFNKLSQIFFIDILLEFFYVECGYWLKGH